MNNDSFLVIYDWMASELGLKGTDLIVYALIWGFTRDGRDAFKGSLDYVAQWVGGRRNTALAAVRRLQEAGLVENTQRCGQTSLYRAHRTPYDAAAEPVDTRDWATEAERTNGADTEPAKTYKGAWGSVCENGDPRGPERKQHALPPQRAPGDHNMNKDLSRKERSLLNGIRMFASEGYGEMIRKDDPRTFEKLLSGNSGYSIEMISEALGQTADALHDGRIVKTPMKYLTALLRIWKEEGRVPHADGDDGDM